MKNDGSHDNPYDCLRKAPELPSWLSRLLSKYDLGVAYDSASDKIAIGVIGGGIPMRLKREDLQRRQFVTKQLKEAFGNRELLTPKGMIK